MNKIYIYAIGATDHKESWLKVLTLEKCFELVQTLVAGKQASECGQNPPSHIEEDLWVWLETSQKHGEDDLGVAKPVGEKTKI